MFYVIYYKKMRTHKINDLIFGKFSMYGHKLPLNIFTLNNLLEEENTTQIDTHAQSQTSLGAWISMNSL